MALNDAQRNELVDLIAAARDAAPRLPNDADSWDVLDAITPAVEQIVARHVAEALEAVGHSVGTLLRSNPTNGDGSNYALSQLLRLVDKQAGSELPSLAAAAEEKRRADESYERYLQLNAEAAAIPQTSPLTTS